MARTAFLFLSSQCNRSCSYCFNKQAPFNIKRKELVKICNIGEITKALLGLSVSEVVLTGGEPLMLGNRLISLVKNFSDNGIICSLDTNGTLLTFDLINDLSSAGLKNVYLSTKYLKIIEPSITDYLKNKFKLSAIHVFNGRDYLDLPRIIGNYESRFDSVVAQPAWYNDARRRGCVSRLSTIEWENMETILQSISLKYKDNLDYLRAAYGRKGKSPGTCHIGEKNFVIYNDGEVYRCFHRQDLMIGNIFNDSTELINDNLLKAFEDVSDANCFGSQCFSLFL